MKKMLLLFIAVALSSSITLAQKPNTALGFEANTMSLSLSGGAFIPTTGRYDATLKISDLLETGPTFAGSLTYSISPIVSLRGTFDFAYNYFESKYRPAGKEPAFVAPTITADAVVHRTRLRRKRPVNGDLVHVTPPACR